MARPVKFYVFGFFLAPLLLFVALPLGSQAQPIQRGRERLQEPVYRVADAVRNAPIQRDHPLTPLLQICNNSLVHCKNNIRDYSALLVKREQVDGVLMDHQFITMKIRHERADANSQVTVPFSVYMRFEGPEKLKGREVIWIKGQNKGKLIAHEGGGLIGFFSVWLDPKGATAMQGQRRPISQIGIENLLIKLIEQSKHDMQFGQEGDFRVRVIKDGPKIDERPCTLVEVTHLVRRAFFEAHVARIFIDHEYNLPIRYAAWDWPVRPGEQPALIEEYTYQNVKLNVNFNDTHFNHKNKEYNF